MKKLLFAICAVAALASCSKEEVVSYDKGEAIGFANPFVNKATRADYSQLGNPLKAFKVYGTVTPTATSTTEKIYDGANVESTTGALDVAWTCDVTNYWQPLSTYNFAAIADGEATTFNLSSYLPATINHTVLDGDEDLLYATATVTTDDDAVPAPADVNSNNCVAFDFTHLLSKMQFTVKNATNQTYKVTDISVTGVAKVGTYTVDGETWVQDGDSTTSLTFGTAEVAANSAGVVASATRQILPVNQTLNVTITYKVMQGANEVGTLEKSGTITTPQGGYVKNTVYNVVATLTGNAITFTVSSVGGWSTPTPPNIEL